jgi:hypothetical protein
VAAEAEDPSAVPVVEDLEGSLVAGADVLDEPLIGESGKEPARLAEAKGVRPWRGSGLHPLSIGNFGAL